MPQRPLSLVANRPPIVARSADGGSIGSPVRGERAPVDLARAAAGFDRRGQVAVLVREDAVQPPHVEDRVDAAGGRPHPLLVPAPRMTIDCRACEARRQRGPRPRVGGSARRRAEFVASQALRQSGGFGGMLAVRTRHLAAQSRCGKHLPGIAQSGDRTRRTRCITARSSGENMSACTRLSTPTPCSPVIEPPASMQYLRISAATRRRLGLAGDRSS